MEEEGSAGKKKKSRKQEIKGKQSRQGRWDWRWNGTMKWKKWVDVLAENRGVSLR